MIKRLLEIRSHLPVWVGNVGIVGSVTSLLFLVRFLSLLQLWELSLFDVWLRSRPSLGPDPRIVIVGLDETDFQRVGGWPISDRELASLINRIKAQNPKVIGLDIYRDLPVSPGHQTLAEVMRSTPNLIGIQRVVDNLNTSANQGGLSKKGVGPPPILAEAGQVGANDFPQDIDGRLRRSFLYLSSSDNQTVLSFAFRMAIEYLADQGISPEVASEETEEIRLGKTSFFPLSGSAGGYVREDARGYQLFLNYRSGPNKLQQVSLTDILQNKIAPDTFRDRIVLIGSTAPSLKDYSLTPYGGFFQFRDDEGNWQLSYSKRTTTMTGVEIHGNLVSFFLDAALGARSPIRTLPGVGEWLIIIMSATIGTTAIARWRTIDELDHLLLGQTILHWTGLFILLLGGSYILFILGWWLPIVPCLLALSGAAAVKVGGTLLTRLLRSYQKIGDYARTLEIKVEERTEELRAKNADLEKTLSQLETAQERIIAQERLASLGSLTAGVAHEIRNPLNFVNNFAHIAVELSTELAEELTVVKPPPETESILSEIFLEFNDCIGSIQQNGQRIERIVESMLSHTQDDAGHSTPTNVNILLKEALELVAYNMQAKHPEVRVQIVAQYDPQLATTTLIAQTVSKAIINILTNAWEAMERRYRLNVPDYQPQLEITTTGTAEQLEIVIRDNGDGIAEEIRGKIFDPFFTMKPTGEGTGLGLSLAHQALVAGHQGAIDVESMPQDYTQFKIMLPVVSSPEMSEELGESEDLLLQETTEFVGIPSSQVFEIEEDVFPVET